MLDKRDDFFNILYQKTKDKVLTYIIARCGNTGDIDDIFQETFLEIIKLIKKKGIAYFQEPEALVMTIAKRKLYQHFHAGQKLGIDKIRYESLENAVKELACYEDFTVEDAMVRKEICKKVQKILEKQDVLTRKIFYLRFYVEISIREIAEVLEISEATVKNRLYRTLKSIRRELGEEAEDL